MSNGEWRCRDVHLPIMISAFTSSAVPQAWHLRAEAAYT